jgi:FkbM family methyltransferase
VIRRRLPATSGGGSLVVSAAVGGLRYVFRSSSRWDPELLRVANALVRRGDVVWDVGANLGLFSKAAAHAAGAEGVVLSIEADIDAVRLLNRTVRSPSRGHAPITVLPVAASKSSGLLRFCIAKRARSTNAIEGFGSTQTGGFKETRLVPAVTLDSLLAHFAAPNVLKIDVEGAELDVLDGARLLLKEARPAIYCEVCGRTVDEVNSTLIGMAYETFDGSGFDDPRTSTRVSATTFNLVALPNEALGSL